MGRAIAIGERARVAGFALAGAFAVVAEDPEAVREAWRHLPDDTALVVLTPAAADALGVEQKAEGARQDGTGPLIAVMPP